MRVSSTCVKSSNSVNQLSSIGSDPVGQGSTTHATPQCLESRNLELHISHFHQRTTTSTRPSVTRYINSSQSHHTASNVPWDDISLSRSPSIMRHSIVSPSLRSDRITTFFKTPGVLSPVQGSAHQSAMTVRSRLQNTPLKHHMILKRKSLYLPSDFILPKTMFTSARRVTICHWAP